MMRLNDKLDNLITYSDGLDFQIPFKLAILFHEVTVYLAIPVLFLYSVGINH